MKSENPISFLEMVSFRLSKTFVWSSAPDLRYQMPPMPSSFSKHVTSCPSSSSCLTVVSPDGPVPITHTFIFYSSLRDGFFRFTELEPLPHSAVAMPEDSRLLGISLESDVLG